MARLLTRAFAGGRVACAAVAVWLTCTATVAAQPLPPPLTQPINDFANVVDPESARQMDALIRSLQRTTGDVVVVATVDTFQPYATIDEYAVKMFQNGGRGIGIKGKDNGVLVLLAVDDRQVWVEVGYGLEGYITDGFSGETSRQTMVPYFKQGDFGGGLLAGSQRLAVRVAEGQGKTLGDDVAPRRARERERDIGSPIPWPIVIFVLLIIISRMMRGGRRRRTWGNNWSGWSSGVGPFGGGFGGGYSGGSSGGFGGGFGGFGGGRSGGGGGGASW
jgi:uncharacterized protein